MMCFMNRKLQLPEDADAGDANVAQTMDRLNDFVPTVPIRMSFRGAPLEAVLKYLGEAAGYLFRVRPNVDLKARVDAWSDHELNREEALSLLQDVLNQMGCAAIRDGRMLTIIRSQDAKKSFLPLR